MGRENDPDIQKLIESHVADQLPGVTIEVSFAKRWQRQMVVARWEGFAGLLAEQRFRRLVACIPAQVFERDLAGMVWFELTPDESVDDYMKMPRSADVANRRSELIAAMKKSGLVARLEEQLGDEPEDACGGAFELTRAVLKDAGLTPKKIESACLCLIGLGAYCDCQALLGEAREELG